MLRKLELESLQSELSAVKTLLIEAQTAKDAVGSIQFAQRKQELENEIRSLDDAKESQAGVALYFHGAPVIGSRGIVASFAGKMLEQFQDIISRQFASAEIGLLGERGPVPLRSITDLMVTGIVQGSFGFILNEVNDKPPMFDTVLKETLTDVLNIINAAGSDQEDVFIEAAEKLDQRTLMALKDFFINLDSSDAAMRFVGDKHEFTLDGEAVHRARIRTEATQIDEDDKQVSGILIGFLPEHRRFELQLALGEIISGSATKESAEQYLNAMKEGTLAVGARCTASIKERTVNLVDRPSRLVFRLLEFKELGRSS